ncbi:MAG: PilZ domain-containing protein [Acidobacteriota bacterium]
MSKLFYLVGPERQILKTFRSVWRETGLETRRYVSGEAALQGIRNEEDPPNGVLITYPLWDTPLGELIRGIRSAESNGHGIPTFVVVPEGSLPEVSSLDDLGVTVLSEAESRSKLGDLVKSELFPVQRAGQRMVVRMEVQLGTGRLLRLCQSENLSISGMLIRTSEKYPIGSTIRFEFVLPDDEEPICGEAQIVRYTHPDVEMVPGIGVRFVSFEDDGQERLERFISR